MSAIQQHTFTQEQLFPASNKPIRKGGRPRKYQTEEERKIAHRSQQRKYLDDLLTNKKSIQELEEENKRLRQVLAEQGLLDRISDQEEKSIPQSTPDTNDILEQKAKTPPKIKIVRKANV